MKKQKNVWAVSKRNVKVLSEKSWYCLRKAELKVETEVCRVLCKSRQFG